MSLSICVLTRNAENIIERALGSVAGLGAEVVVADTGSTDGTCKTARALGATVLQIPWHDDFGSAQNRVMERAIGDWVFWLNPDEEVLPHGLEQIAELTARPEALAYGVRVQEMTKADRPDRVTELVDLRLFRRHPAVRYVGRLHPHLVTPLDEVARQERKRIYPSNLCIRHHAYASVVTVDKLRWATRLLELELRDRPGQIHYLIEYGRNLLRLNDAKGHAILASASDFVLAALDAPTAPAPTVALLLEYLLSVSPEQSESQIAPMQVRELAQRWFPKSPPLLWALAHRAFLAGDFVNAADLLERLVQFGRLGDYDGSTPFDPAIMHELALLNLGRCYIRLGQLDRAEVCFGPLLNNPTHQAQARAGVATVQKLKSKSVS